MERKFMALGFTVGLTTLRVAACAAGGGSDSSETPNSAFVFVKPHG